MTTRSVFLGEHTTRAILYKPRFLRDHFLKERLTDLKLATLLFDEVIVCHETLGDLPSLASAIGVEEREFLKVFKSAEYSGSESKDAARLESTMKIVTAAVDPKRNPAELWDDEGHVRDAMKPFVRSCIESHGHDVSKMSQEEFEYHAYCCVQGVMIYPAAYLIWKAERPDLAFFACDEIEAIALQALLKLPKVDEGELFGEGLYQSVPALYKLPWNEVFELRSRQAVFRAKLWDDAGPADGASECLSDLLFSLLKYTPSVKTTTLKSLCSRVPIPIVSGLYGAVDDALELRKAIQFQQEYGWLILLQAPAKRRKYPTAVGRWR